MGKSFKKFEEAPFLFVSAPTDAASLAGRRRMRRKIE
jgi:hypothetical protein